MKNHLDMTQEYHLSLTVKKNYSLEQQVVELDNRVQHGNEAVVHLQDQCDKFKRRFDEARAKLMEMEQSSGRYDRLEVRVSTMEGLVDTRPSTVLHTGISSSSTVSAITKKVDETTRIAAKVEAGVSTAQQKITSLESKVATVDRQVGCIRFGRITVICINLKCKNHTVTRKHTSHLIVLCHCTCIICCLAHLL